ncbi:hypothetical protein Mal15_42530 [Stieleria maiorica]|uniref:Uncharacterized protein n=1 Tax=Stieleria maiorica TaxID=2795974 RepID=A0A5B9MH10_9BACT|nr:hypothetical protein Mal15_42530 [Stieleria maiorica]
MTISVPNFSFTTATANFVQWRFDRDRIALIGQLSAFVVGDDGLVPADCRALQTERFELSGKLVCRFNASFTIPMKRALEQAR